MKKRAGYPALAAIAAVGLVSTACEQLGIGVEPDAQIDAVVAYQTYHYVLILDLEDSEPNTYGTNGADIDGVELRHGGAANFADNVEAIGFGTGETDFQDQNQVLGAPEGTCDVEDGNFVSLGGSGGAGGHLIVSFQLPDGDLQEIVNGDTVSVHECGDQPEEYTVYVGVGTSVTDPNWHLCGQNMTGVAECTVMNLPLIPFD